MSEKVERLRATLAELEAELHELEQTELDESDQAALRHAVDEIQTALVEARHESLEHHSLAERLNTAARNFDESHPNLSRIIGGLADILSQMGI